MCGLRKLSSLNLEAHQTTRAEDKVRRTPRKVREVVEDQKEHRTRAPKEAGIFFFRRCKTENMFPSIHKLSQ